MRRRPYIGRHCNSEGMGICFSKAGALQIKNPHHHNSTGTEADQTGSRNKSPVRSFESPRWSVETGDKGKLGALFYKRWPFSTAAETSPVLENFIGGIQNFQVRQIPQPLDSTLTATTSYASLAQDTFTFSREPDNVEDDLSSIRKSKTSNRRSADGGASEEEIVPDKLDGVEEIKVLNVVGDEILLVNRDENNALGNVNQEIDSHGATCKAEAEPSLLKEVDKCNQDYVDLNLSYKSAGMLEGPEQRSSMFEFCFPVSARWASVVNAARQSSCLSPEKSLFRTESTNDLPHSGELECNIDDGMQQQQQQQPRQLQSLRVLDDTRFSVSSGCSSSEGHVCLGCCGRARVGTMTSSTTASCSKSVHFLEETDQKAHQNLGAQNSVSCEGRNDIINKCLQVNILPAWSRRENPNFCTAECSTSGSNGEGIQDPSDGDTFFSFPNSPSAKNLEEMRLGNSMEDMKSTRMLEDIGLRQQQQQQQYGQLEIDDQSPRGGSTYTMMEGGFGSPFPVLGASGRRTCPILEKKLKFFSLERATAAAVARKISTLDVDKDNPCQIDGHRDVEDYGADLFEIEDVQPMKSKGISGLDFPMNQSVHACSEDCENIVPSNTAVPLCDAGQSIISL